MSHPNRLLAALAAGALALPLLLAGCSASPDDTAEAPSGSSAAAEWGACMRENGVDIEDPTAEQFATGTYRFPAETDSDVIERAQAACSTGGPQTSDDDQRAYAQQNRDFVDCMAEAGIEGFVLKENDSILDFADVDQSAPAFETANAECAAAAGYQTQGK